MSAILRELRPSPISPDERARALAVLPAEGELPPDAKERAKLSALEALLVYHERQGLFDIKVIDVPQAVVGIHQRAVLLIYRPGCDLSASEFQALVAHGSATNISGRIMRTRARGTTDGGVRSWS